MNADARVKAAAVVLCNAQSDGLGVPSDYEDVARAALEAVDALRDKLACVACEDTPKHPNIPCAVCGRGGERVVTEEMVLAGCKQVSVLFRHGLNPLPTDGDNCRDQMQGIEKSVRRILTAAFSGDAS